MATIEIACAGIACFHTERIEIAGKTDWTGKGCIKDGLRCPKCRIQADFFDSVCPGCVTEWPDCPLYDSFACPANRNTITDSELSMVEKGICPYRVDGTFSFDSGIPERGTEEIDLSKRATPESGNAVASAIREYLKSSRKSNP